MSYSGPDGDANVSGTCTDRAGHTSAPRAFGFKYDDTAPELTKAEVKKGDRFVTLSWAATGGVAAVSVTRADLAATATAPMYTGTGTSWTDRSVKNGVRYSYVLKVEDAAGNAATKTIVATPRPALYQPARDARVRRGAPDDVRVGGRPEGELLQLPAPPPRRRPLGQGAHPLAREAVVRAPAALASGGREDVDAHGRALPLVRLARDRASVAAPLRQARGLERVLGRLSRRPDRDERLAVRSVLEPAASPIG